MSEYDYYTQSHSLYKRKNVYDLNMI